MNISVTPSYDVVKYERILDKTAVVIDALRASATMITAISNGCERILPVEDTEVAMDTYKLTEGDKLLCGESRAKKLPGYDLGNSPLEYTRQMVEGKIIIYCTSNGTKAVKSAFDANKTLIGTFVNASMVAAKILEEGRDTVLVCAGTKHCFSMEDMLAAGCILDKMKGMEGIFGLDDYGLLALRTYRSYRNNLMEMMQGTRHYEYIKSLGFEEDIKYCFSEDICDILPVYEEGVVVDEKSLRRD